MDGEKERLLRAWQEQGDDNAALSLWTLARRHDDHKLITRIFRNLARAGVGWSIRSAWHVAEPPRQRLAWPRPLLELLSEEPTEAEGYAYFIDGDSGTVGAIVVDGQICLGWSKSATAWRVRGNTCERLAPAPLESLPDWFDVDERHVGVLPCLFSELIGPGARYLLCVNDDDLDPELIQKLLSLHSEPQDALPHILEATQTSLALLLRIGRSKQAPSPNSLSTYFAELRRREYTITCVGNERGDGFLEAFECPYPPTARTLEEALLQVARDSEVVQYEVGTQYEANPEFAQNPIGGYQEGFVELVSGLPTRGWYVLEPLETFAKHFYADCGGYLDPHTRNGRAASVHYIPGAAIVETLERWVDTLGVIALHSSPNQDESVVGIHVLGGRDRATGQLQGVILIRVWT